MKRKDSFYQLILSIVFVIVGCICFIPDVNFLQLLLCICGLIILVIGLFFLIRGLTKDYDKSISKSLIIGGLIVSLIGISFSTLVWVLFNIFATILGIIFIIYALIGLIMSIKDKYGLLRVRILSIIKFMLYLSIGVLIILDCYFHHLIIDYLLGIILIVDGSIGISAYISSYKIYHNTVIDAEEYTIDDVEDDSLEE